MQQGWAQCSKARGCGVTPRPKTHTGSMHQLQGTTGTVCLAVLLQLSLPTGAAHISLPSQGAPWSIWAATKLQIGVMHVEGGGTCAPVPLCGESLVASLGKGGTGTLLGSRQWRSNVAGEIYPTYNWPSSVSAVPLAGHTTPSTDWLGVTWPGPLSSTLGPRLGGRRGTPGSGPAGQPMAMAAGG